jgi:hypothetical protein
MTGAKIIAEIRLQLDELEKTLQAERQKQQAADDLIWDNCKLCGREWWTKAHEIYSKICPLCEIEKMKAMWEHTLNREQK